jgi:hypothetical protein
MNRKMLSRIRYQSIPPPPEINLDVIKKILTYYFKVLCEQSKVSSNWGGPAFSPNINIIINLVFVLLCSKGGCTTTHFGF